MKLFKYKERYIKSNGVIVTKYIPNVPVFISSINLDSGLISEQEIIEYSKNENIKIS